MKVARILLLGGIAWVGWQILVVLGQLLAGPAAIDNETVAVSRTIPSPMETLNVSTLTGRWSLVGSDWDVGFTNAVDADVAQTLLAPPRKDPAWSDSTLAAEKDLLALIDNYQLRAQSAGGYQIYQAVQTAFRGALCTKQHRGVERVVVGRLAVAQGEGRWIVLEIAPSHAASPANDAEKRLLPVPPAQQLVASRWDNDGQLMAQLVQAELSPTALTENWAEGGWIISNSSTDGISIGDGVDCTRGGELIHARFLAGNDHGCTVLILRAGP
jgi:hypothetical protein